MAMDQLDSLSALEQRIQRAAETVAQLRRERQAALEDAAEADSLRERVSELTRELETARAERDALRADKEIVRKRLEKIVEQIDALGAN
jgi:FtsZ-binding cell division protein ZapB